MLSSQTFCIMTLRGGDRGGKYRFSAPARCAWRVASCRILKAVDDSIGMGASCSIARRDSSSTGISPREFFANTSTPFDKRILNTSSLCLELPLSSLGFRMALCKILPLLA